MRANFTRDECHDLSAEKIQRVKCFMFTRCEIYCVPAIFERRRGRLGSKISDCGQLADVAVYFAMSGLPRKQTPSGRVGMSAGCQTRTSILDWREFFLANDAPPLWRAPVDEDGQYSFAVAL